MHHCFRVGVFAIGLFALCNCLTSKALSAGFDETPKKNEDKKENKTPTFKDDVMPLLSTACMNCHSGKKKKAGVDVSSYDTVMKIVKPNEPEKSRLIKSVTGQGAKLMPPKVGLNDSQVKLLKDWIS